MIRTLPETPVTASRRAWLAKATLLAFAALGAADPIRPAAAQAQTQAQDAFPSQAITIVVPFGPGSGTDITARLIGQKLAESLGRPVVIENKPGANGTIGAQQVARAKPDGYTLLLGTNSTNGANPALVKTLSYDPAKDFAPVNRLVVFTSIVVAAEGAPFKNMRELIEQGRQRELSLATGNASGIVQGETLARRTGWKTLTRVPYKSNPPALTDVIAGRVDFMFADIASALPHIRSGALRALAVTSRAKSPLMPELPTVAELGVPDYDLSGWISLYAPAGTPRAVVDRLNAETTRALESPDIRKKFSDMGGEVSPMTVAQFASWTGQELTKWTRLVREAGIQPE